MKLSKELLEKAKTATSVEELLEKASAEGVELSAGQAAKAFSGLHKMGELSDEELTNETPSDEVLSDEETMNEEPSEETSGSMENPDIMPSSLEDMNVGQLQKLARANGLEPPKNAKKQEQQEFVKFILEKYELWDLKIKSCCLHVKFCYSNRIRHDLDNSICILKPFLDQCVLSGMLIDDDYKVVRYISTTAVVEKENSPRVDITFYSIVYQE